MIRDVRAGVRSMRTDEDVKKLASPSMRCGPSCGVARDPFEDGGRDGETDRGGRNASQVDADSRKPDDVSKG